MNQTHVIASEAKQSHRRVLWEIASSRYALLAMTFFAVFLAMTLFVFSNFAYATETLDRILVIVNDEIITEQDLRVSSQPFVAQLRATLSGAELEEKIRDVREKVLQQLVDERLVRSEAKREKITVDEKEVDEMMDDMKKKFPSEEVFGQVLRDQGMSFTKLREKFHDQILGRRIVDIKVRSEITISPGEVRDYYDRHRDEFNSPEKAQVRQVLIRVGQHRTDEEARTLAEAVMGKIQAGESMEELAKTYSESAEAKEGGDMGWIEMGQLIGAIDDAIFKLETGQLTTPIKTQLGYHLFRVEDKRAAEPRAFEQVRNKIEGLIIKKKTSERLTRYVQELRKNAFISDKTH